MKPSTSSIHYQPGHTAHVSLKLALIVCSSVLGAAAVMIAIVH